MTISRQVTPGPETGSPASSTRSRIAAGLLLSAALHGALILALPHLRTAARDTAPDPVRLSVRLPAPAPLPAAARPAQAPAPRTRTMPVPASGARVAVPAPRPEPIPEPIPEPLPVAPARTDTAAAGAAAPAGEPFPDPLAATPPPAVDLMTAARQDAATFARELNKEENAAGRAFGNSRQALLDRRFEDAYQAARRWNGALPVKEVTRASDGSTRVYMLSTPLGKVCMFTRLENRPLPRQNPREKTWYGACNR